MRRLFPVFLLLLCAALFAENARVEEDYGIRYKSFFTGTARALSLKKQYEEQYPHAILMSIFSDERMAIDPDIAESLENVFGDIPWGESRVVVFTVSEGEDVVRGLIFYSRNYGFMLAFSAMDDSEMFALEDEHDRQEYTEEFERYFARL